MLHRVKRCVAGVCIFGVIVCAGCTGQTDVSALAVDPEIQSQANPQSINIDGKPADTVSVSDVINRSRRHVKRTGEIYLMRGLANVFSRGIDDMAVYLRGRGYDAVNFSYSQWQPIAADIVARAKTKKVSQPVMIIGHSLGGNESSKFANYLATNGVKVALVVTFDPVETGHVGAGIGEVVNYYLPKSADNRVLPKDGFTGKLKNFDVTVDPSITHNNVDKNPKLQASTYASITRLTKVMETRESIRELEQR